jgi:hypothetical protein
MMGEIVPDSSVVLAVPRCAAAQEALFRAFRAPRETPKIKAM